MTFNEVLITHFILMPLAVIMTAMMWYEMACSRFNQPFMHSAYMRVSQWYSTKILKTKPTVYDIQTVSWIPIVNIIVWCALVYDMLMLLFLKPIFDKAVADGTVFYKTPKGKLKQVTRIHPLSNKISSRTRVYFPLIRQEISGDNPCPSFFADVNHMKSYKLTSPLPSKQFVILGDEEIIAKKLTGEIGT